MSAVRGLAVWALVVIAAATPAAAAPAGAAPAGAAPAVAAVAHAAPADRIVGAVRGRAGAVLLVGAGGAVFEVTADAIRQVTTGGVATTLPGARSDGADGVLAVGDKAPAYRWHHGSWSATPVRRAGHALLGVGKVPTLAVGRRGYVWSGEWTELVPALPAEPLALESSAPRAVIALLPRNRLVRHDGRVWRALAAPRPRSDLTTLLVGDAGPVLAVGADGSLTIVGGKRPTSVLVPATLAGFRAQAAAGGGKRPLYLVGSTGGTTRLARLDGTRLVAVSPAPPLTPGDRAVALLSYSEGRLVIALAQGTLLTRDAAGAWTAAQLPEAAAAAAVAPPAANPPASVGPAPRAP